MTLAPLLAAASVLAAAAPALAQTAAAQPAPATPVAPVTVTTQPEMAGNSRQSTTGDPERRICRSQVATGSRLGATKICKTARQWEEQRAAAKAELDRSQRPGGTNF